MMKTILITFLLVFSFISSYAQFNTDKLYVGAGVGVTYNDDDINRYIPGTIKTSIKAGYKYNNRLALASEFTIAQGLTRIGSGLSSEFKFYKLNRVLVGGRYTFLNTKISPFIELTGGFSRLKEPNISKNREPIVGSTNYGLAGSAEVGLKIYGFYVSYSFDHFGRTPQESAFDPSSEDISMDYHGIQIGYLYELGRRK